MVGEPAYILNMHPAAFAQMISPVLSSIPCGVCKPGYDDHLNGRQATAIYLGLFVNTVVPRAGFRHVRTGMKRFMPSRSAMPHRFDAIQ